MDSFLDDSICAYPNIMPNYGPTFFWQGDMCKPLLYTTILYCLKNRIPFLETQDILESYGLTIIGGTGDEKQ